jgi:hypothetical protein
LLQPVYAFDHLVLPLGTKVQGQIARIGAVSGKQLTLSILNADFTPARPIQVSFDEIVLADGRHLPLHVAVVPGSGQVIRLVDSVAARSGPAKNGLSAKIVEAKQEWQQAMQQVRQPGKLHRAWRMGLEQLPVRPQYIDAKPSKSRSANLSALRQRQAVWCARLWSQRSTRARPSTVRRFKPWCPSHCSLRSSDSPAGSTAERVG